MRTFSLGEDEAIIIGSGVVIRVLQVSDDEVQLEIDSPGDVPIRPSQEHQSLLQPAAEPEPAV